MFKFVVFLSPYSYRGQLHNEISIRWFTNKHKKDLFEAWEKVKAEFMKTALLSSETWTNIEIDRHYKNDLRYLRVWLKLMYFVDYPGSLLGTKEVNHVRRKRSLFYHSYALYFEKMKFEEAEKKYHLKVKNLTEPINDLQELFDQFHHHIEQYKNKKIQRQGSKTTNKPICAESNFLNYDDDKENNEKI